MGHTLRHAGLVRAVNEKNVKGKLYGQTKTGVHEVDPSGRGMWKVCKGEKISRGQTKLMGCFKPSMDWW